MDLYNERLGGALLFGIIAEQLTGELRQDPETARGGASGQGNPPPPLSEVLGKT